MRAPRRAPRRCGSGSGLDLAAEAAQRRRGEHALGRAADAHDGVHAGARDRARDRGRQVAVADQLDPRARRADLVDQLLVARALEDHDRDVVDAPAERLGDPAEVLARALADVDLARGDRPDAQLLHVRVGRVDEPAGLRRGEDGDRAGLAVGDEVRALERVDRDVDRLDVGVRFVPADGLADVQHRRLVALALADDDPAGELDLVHRPAHRLGGGGVGLVLLAAAHEPGGRERRRLGDPNHLQREQLFHSASSGGARISAGSAGGR